MIYMLTISHRSTQYQWYINTEDGEIYSVPQLNRAVLPAEVLRLVKILLNNKTANGELKECSYSELAKQIKVTENKISKLLKSFCQLLNITHCIPQKIQIVNKDLLKDLQYFEHEIEELKKKNFHSLMSKIYRLKSRLLF